MKGKAPFSIWYLLIAFMVMIILQNYIATPPIVKLSYSDFKKQLSEGKIEKVVIDSKMIKGFYYSDEEEPVRFSTVRVEDPSLVEQLEEKNVNYSGQYESPLLRGVLGWVVPLVIIFLIWGVVFKRMNPGAGVMTFGRSKARLYAQDKERTTFEDVAGVEEATEELKEIVEYLRTPDKFRKLGGKIPKGALLVGPPGTGKTLLAKAVAGEAGVPFFNISGSEFVEMFVGVGAARVRDLFQQAQQKAPCIVFIDELDALGKARGMNPVGGHDEREQTLNQLLVEMDGFDTGTNVIIMAATNRPEILDPALLRPGRFDRQVLVDRPDLNGRDAILSIHARHVKLSPEVDLKTVAARTSGLVGADLANIVNEAALLAARKGKNEVGMQDFEEAIDRILAGLEKKNRVMNRHEKEIVAHHECGHALMAEMLPTTDPVHKVSIVPRGIAALGYTLQLPTEDRYLMTQQELIDKLSVLLGGRAAEEIVFAEVSTGAQNDLQRATDIARRMVTDYGMSSLGPMSFEKEKNPIFPNNPFMRNGGYSEHTAQEIDKEVKRIIDETYELVSAKLAENKNTLVKVALELMDKETIEGDQLREILKECGIEKPIT